MSFGFGVGDFVKVIELANSLRKRFSDAPKQYNDIHGEVQNLSQLLEEVYENGPLQELDDTQKGKLETNLQACRNVLEDLNKKLGNYEDLAPVPKHGSSKGRGIRSGFKRQWKRVQWEPEDIRDLRLRIATNASNLSSFTTLCMNSSIQAGVNELRQMQNEEGRRRERLDFIDWLKCTDYASQQNDLDNEREEGTGQWLIDSAEFQHWSSHSGLTLFCPGIPGAGKTMLSSRVIRELDQRVGIQPGVGLAFLYFDYKKQHQTITDCLSGIFAQLAIRPSGIRHEARAFYRHYTERNTRPTIADLTSIIRRMARGLDRVFLVLDALDECASLVRGPLLDSLLELQAHSEANVFATSRPSDVGMYFKDALSLHISAHEDDVRRYLESQIRQQRRPLLQRPELQKDIVTQIIATIDGMFLLAKLHLDSLRNKTTVKAVKTALQDLPKGPKAIDIAYEAAIERIENQADEVRILAKQVLCWIVYARRPLEVQELRHALAVVPSTPALDEEDLPETEDMVSACAGLVVIDEERGIIRLAHYTTQEFFERFRDSWVPDGDAEIARVCITYLTIDLFPPSLTLDGDGADGHDTEEDTASVDEYSDDEDFDDEMGSEKSTVSRLRDLCKMLNANPFLWYAAVYWGLHVRESDWTTLEGPVLRFLENGAKVALAMEMLIFCDCQREGGATKETSAIHLTAYFGLLEATTALIRTGLSPDSRDDHNRTPLSWAAAVGAEAVVEVLLERDDVHSDPVDVDNGQTPLSYAAEGGHTNIVRRLLETNNVSILKETATEESSLSAAAYEELLAIKQLLQAYNSVKVNSKDSEGKTPLAHAAHRGHEEIVRQLLEQEEIEVNAKDQNGLTPLAHAAQQGHDRIVRLLLEQDENQMGLKMETKTEIAWAGPGFDNDFQMSRNRHGLLPLYLAAESGNIKIVQMLVEQENVRATYAAFETQERQTPLFPAARNGHRAVVDFLLQRVAHADAKNEVGQTALFWAARGGQLRMVEFFLGLGLAPDSKDQSGRTPLSWAAGPAPWARESMEGNEAVARLLLDLQDGNADSNDKKVQPPLSWTAGAFRSMQKDCENGTDLVRLLADRNDVQADSKDSFGRSPPSWMAEERNDAGALLLLGRGAEVDAKNDERRTPLSVAAQRCNDNMADLTTKESMTPLSWAASGSPYRHDGEIDSRDTDGRTPLSWAAQYDKVGKMVNLLLKNGANAHSIDNNERTPLSWAAAQGNCAAMLLLLDFGTPCDRADRDGRTPLSWAASEARRCGDEDRRKTLKLLMREGARLDSQDITGRTPLSLAAERHDGKVVKCLLEKGSNVNLQDHKGRTPLSWAAEGHGRRRTIRMLLEHGALCNSPDFEGRTPLSWAAGCYPDEETLRLLLDAGADAGARDNMGRTPLSWATKDGSIDVARLLLEHDAPSDAEDCNGRTPLSWAAGFKREDLARLFLERGVDADFADKDGRTPLSWAAQKHAKWWWVDCQGKLVQVLLEQGDVDVNSKDGIGRTPLWWATEWEAPEAECEQKGDAKPAVSQAVLDLLRTKMG